MHVDDAIVVAAADAHAVLDVVLRMTALDRRKIEDGRGELVARAAALEAELGGA